MICNPEGGIALINNENDRRQFQGLNAYFGQQEWFQFSMNFKSSMVTITLSCFDTGHPTFAPSIAPTTPAPTLAPTEMCTLTCSKVSPDSQRWKIRSGEIGIFW